MYPKDALNPKTKQPYTAEELDQISKLALKNWDKTKAVFIHYQGIGDPKHDCKGPRLTERECRFNAIQALKKLLRGARLDNGPSC